MRIKVLSGGRKSIELPLSDAELNFQMRRIGIEETVPMCRLVEVSEKDNPLQRFEGQTVNMDEVNFFAKRMESQMCIRDSGCVFGSVLHQNPAEDHPQNPCL